MNSLLAWFEERSFEVFKLFYHSSDRVGHCFDRRCVEGLVKVLFDISAVAKMGRLLSLLGVLLQESQARPLFEKFLP